MHLCRARDLESGPIELELDGRSFVGYRTAGGRVAVLAGRCSHLGARLVHGSVVGERIVCPLHAWEYGSDGVCERIPATESIPAFARQCSYPIAECGGQVFFFSRPRAAYPLPFFDGQTPRQLLAAEPFELVADAPWYFVGANGFDLQHFRVAHDRTFIGEPQISSPSAFCRRIVVTLAVTGDSWSDRLMRRVAGPRVTMSISVWSGSLIFVEAVWQRLTTYGLVSVHPLDAQRTRARTIVWVRRRHWLDRLDVRIRRSFIRTFLRSDLPRIAGLRYQPGNLIPADRAMADYFAWLEQLDQPSAPENS